MRIISQNGAIDVPYEMSAIDDLKYKLKCRIVDVRSEFFGKD